MSSGKFLDSPYTTLMMPKCTMATAHMLQGMSVEYMVIPRKLLSFWPAFSRQLISACTAPRPRMLVVQAPSCSRRLRTLSGGGT